MIKKVLLLAILSVVNLTVSADVKINAQNFPDPNFRSWVLGRDSNGDGVLSDAEIACVTSINLKERDLQSLKGIEYFTALTSLYCNHNKLTALDVSGCTALKVLHCYSNRITALDVSGCTALTELQCYSCPLKMLDVTKNTALTQLVCYYNQLTALDVSQNTELTQLICNYNQLTALDVSKNTKLDTLKCEINQLTALDVTKNTKLEYLDCSQNQLTALDASKNTALIWLICSQNQLATLDVLGCTALTRLNCSQNQLTTLDVSGCTALTGLNCSQNQLTMLDVSKNTLLTSLGCGWNLLTALDVLQNTALTQLVCSGNLLTALDLSNNKALTNLNCYTNQIKGAGMDELVKSLPTVSRGDMFVIWHENGKNEQNEMTTTQVAAAKAKGWTPHYTQFDTQNGWHVDEYAGIETPQPAYRPFVEDDKVWKVGAVNSGNPVPWVEYYYFDGDTIIDGKTCKQMMRQRYVNPDFAESNSISQDNSLSYVGAWYEENKQVYKYDSTNEQFKLMYDFSVDANDTLQIDNLSYVVGPKQSGGMEGFKGVYRDVWLWADGESIYSVPWLEGVGSTDAPITNVYPGPVDPAWFLMACVVNDEVIFLNDDYEDGATPAGMNARNRFDFTHTIKTKPQTPMRRVAEQSLYGEYNELLLDINIDPLVDAYLVRIYDESGKAVYEKAINAGSIVGLNIDILTYPKGRYTVTVENNYESFTGEFDTQTTGIEENVKTEKLKNESIYNLQGQRISTLQKGLNIVNGRKIINGNNNKYKNEYD